MNKVYDIITGKIIEQLENGIIPWIKPWQNGLPKNLITGKHYTGINPFLLSDTNFNSPYWLTYNQAKSLKGHVKPMEKARIVIYYKPIERTLTSDDEVSSEETDNQKTNNKKPTFMLRYYHVFNLSQCEIPTENMPDIEPTKTINKIEVCDDLVAKYIDCPDIRFKQNRAFYSASQDYVNMPDINKFNNSELFYSVLFHELVHSTGHVKRLNRFGIDKLLSRDAVEYGKEELIAELGSAYLCAFAGIENKTIESSASYIDNWIKAIKEDNKLVIRSAGCSQKAVNYILGID